MQLGSGMTRTTVHPVADSPDPVAISWVAMLIPFVIVATMVAIAGQHSWAQIAMTTPLLVVPIAILAMRHRARRRAAGS